MSAGHNRQQKQHNLEIANLRLVLADKRELLCRGEANLNQPISVDESFKPVIDSQLKVFESSFPDAHIIVEYKPEAACLRDLGNDSTRLIIITRGLSLPEEHFFRDSTKMPAISGLLAYDAVALVINNHSRDTVMDMDEVRALLAGDDKKNREVVMDGVSETSTVRYVLDSVLKGKPLGKNVVAARSSPQSWP